MRKFVALLLVLAAALVYFTYSQATTKEKPILTIPTGAPPEPAPGDIIPPEPKPTIQEDLEARITLLEDKVAPGEENLDPATIGGVVKGPEGNPLGGVKLTVYARKNLLRKDFFTQVLANTETDAKGIFELKEEVFTANPFTQVDLLADSPAYLPHYVTLQPGQWTEILLKDHGTLEGTVMESGTKKPLAEVSLAFRNRSGQTETYTTDSQGKYRIPRVELQRNIDLRVFRAGFAPESKRIQLLEKETRTYDISLARGLDLVGQVVDLETGVPISGAIVSRDTHPLATTDSGGRFLLPGILQSRVDLTVRRPGYCGLMYTIKRKLASKGEPIAIPLLKAGRLEGRVVDRKSNPVAGVRIQGPTRSTYYRTFNKQFKDLGLPELPAGTRIIQQSRNQETLSDVDGRFALEGIVPSTRTWIIHAYHPDFADGQAGPFELRHPGQQLSGEIRLLRGGTVSGQVTVDGKPTRTRVTLAQESQPGQYSRHHMLETNDQGQFEKKHLYPATYQVSARLNRRDRNPHGGEKFTAILEDEGSVVRNLELKGLKTLPIKGRILSPAGEPVHAAKIYGWASYQDGFISREATSLKDGSYELNVPDLGGITYQVYASSGPSSVARMEVLPGTEEVEMKLPEVGKLALRVFNASTGEPISDLRVKYKTEGSRGTRNQKISADASGLAEIRLPVGSVDLTISSGRFRDVKLKGVQVTSQTDPAPLRVDMFANVRTEIQFRSQDGTPFPGLTSYRITRVEDNRNMGKFRADDYNQVLVLETLPPGQYRISPIKAKIKFTNPTFIVSDQDNVVITMPYRRTGD